MQLQGGQLLAFKDSRAARQGAAATHHGEAPLELREATVSVASDYSKKKHVFRLK